VEQTARVTPRVLLVAPVRELAGDGRVDVRPDLRAAEQLGGVLGGLQQPFQALRAHGCELLLSETEPPDGSVWPAAVGRPAARLSHLVGGLVKTLFQSVEQALGGRRCAG